MKLAGTAATFFIALSSATALAAPIAYDGFDYPPGQLGGQNGGTGDWKDSWQGDADIIVLSGGYDYVDALGNTLGTAGNHIEIQASAGSAKKVTRSVNDKVGEVSETVWMSAILDGTASSAIHNVSLGDGLFMGQGGKNTGSTSWLLADQDGVVADTGVSSDAQAFLVVRVDFTGGDEQAWLWLDPLLDSEPNVASADASGTIKSFEADFVQVQLEVPGAGLDELKFGWTFDDVSSHTAVPERGTAELVLLGLVGLSLRAQSRRAVRPPLAALA